MASTEMSAAGRENMVPPSRSKCPLTTFSASMSQEASGPNSVWQVPSRPYTTAFGVVASSRASLRIAFGGHAVRAGDALRREASRGVLEGVPPVGDGVEGHQIDEVLGEEHV